MRSWWAAAVLAIGCGRDPAPCDRSRGPCGETSGSAARPEKVERSEDAKRRAWRSNAIVHATTCAKFAGQPLAATWDDCTDHIRRELACARDKRGEIECLCLEDGVEKWRFTARDPHLDDQVEATRVAGSNCHMSFQGF